MFIDSHAHLDDDGFAEDLDEVLARARKAGVTRIVSVGGGGASTERAIALARSHAEFVFATAGVSPHDATSVDEPARERLKTLVKDSRVVAVGETGLDYHYDHSPRDVQRSVFEFHIELALEVGLPLVVHCRDAFDDCLRVLGRHAGSGLCGVAHCFTGTEAHAWKFLDLGFLISFAGVLTFKKAKALRAVAARVPFERMLIETDCPYLAPQGRRGSRNEPAFLPLVAETLARICEKTTEEIGVLTSRNAERFYGLPGPAT